MADPIKIILQAQTQQAAAELQKIPDAISEANTELERYNETLKQMAIRQEEARRATVAAQEASAAQWRTLGTPAGAISKTSEAAKSLEKNAFKARMGLLELEHVGRSSADILLMGGNSRMLLAQLPQLIQSLSLMGIGFGAILPEIAAVGAVVGAGALIWSIYMQGVEDTTKKTKELIQALDQVPDILDKIHTLTRAGILSPATANEFADYLNGFKKLYVGPDGKVTRDKYHQEAETVYQPSFTPGQPGTMVPTGRNRTVENPEASLAEARQYVLSHPAITMASQNEAKYKADLNDQLKKSRQDELSGLDQIEAKIHERYQKERDEMALTMQQAGKLVGSPERKAVLAQIEQLKVDESNAIQEARNKAQTNAVAEQMASEQKIRTEAAKRTQTDLQAVEDKITLMEKQQGVKRGELAAVEYTMRLNAAQRALYQGDITEAEYTHLVAQAQAKRIDGEKAYQATLQQTAQLKQELARTEAELQLHTIQSNPFLTNSAKAQASIGPISDLMGRNQEALTAYQETAANTTDDAARIAALTRINELTQQQVDLRRQLDAAKGEDSFGYQLGLAVKHLQDMNNLSHEVAQTFEDVFNTAISSVSTNLTKVIEGTETWSQALKNIGSTILNEIIQDIVQMGVRWIATQILMATVGRSIMAASVAATAPIAAAQSVIWSVPATLSTIASYGASAAAAPGMIALAEGITLATAGFESGGYTFGRQGQVAGVVHGEEFVFSAPATRSIGRDNLEAMHRDALSGGPTETGGGRTINQHFWDSRPHPRKYLGTGPGEHQVIEIVKRNRQKIGIKT